MVWDHEVAGSNPVIPTNNWVFGVAGARACLKSKRTLFNSKRAHNNGPVAQLVERRTEDPCVPGSIPGRPTVHVLEWSKGAACKAGVSWVRIPS